MKQRSITEEKQRMTSKQPFFAKILAFRSKMLYLCMAKTEDFLLWSRKKDRFAAGAARYCHYSCKPLPPKPQSFRTTAANQILHCIVPNSQRYCSCFSAVFSPFYFSVLFFLSWYNATSPRCHIFIFCLFQYFYLENLWLFKIYFYLCTRSCWCWKPLGNQRRWGHIHTKGVFLTLWFWHIEISHISKAVRQKQGNGNASWRCSICTHYYIVWQLHTSAWGFQHCSVGQLGRCESLQSVDRAENWLRVFLCMLNEPETV